MLSVEQRRREWGLAARSAIVRLKPDVTLVLGRTLWSCMTDDGDPVGVIAMPAAPEELRTPASASAGRADGTSVRPPARARYRAVHAIPHADGGSLASWVHHPSTPGDDGPDAYVHVLLALEQLAREGRAGGQERLLH